MIRIHRLTQPDHPLLLNPDHIQTIEATPDTVVTLLNGARFVVMESPEELADEVRRWRASVAAAVAEPGTAPGRPKLTAIVAGPEIASRGIVEERHRE
jgi:flagellar protein FlbD